MGTLDRENCIYNWSSEGRLSLFAARANSADPFARELYRLACEVEDLRVNYDNAREAVRGISEGKAAAERDNLRQAEQIQNQARTIAEMERKVEQLKSTERHLLEEVSRFRSYNEDLRQRHDHQAVEMIRRSGEFAEILASRERQEATIKSLREQLVANVDKSIANVLGGFPPFDAAKLADHGAVLRSHGIAIQSHGGKIDEHESQIQTHEARLDAMEEVFDKIKDAL